MEQLQENSLRPWKLRALEAEEKRMLGVILPQRDIQKVLRRQALQKGIMFAFWRLGASPQNPGQLAWELSSACCRERLWKDRALCCVCREPAACLGPIPKAPFRRPSLGAQRHSGPGCWVGAGPRPLLWVGWADRNLRKRQLGGECMEMRSPRPQIKQGHLTLP